MLEVDALTKSEAEIVELIKNFIDGFHTFYDAWFVGIAEHPEKELVHRHRVRDKDNAFETWMYEFAKDPEVARKIARYFTEELGTMGTAGKDNGGARGVYAYMLKSHTVQ